MYADIQAHTVHIFTITATLPPHKLFYLHSLCRGRHKEDLREIHCVAFHLEKYSLVFSNPVEFLLKAVAMVLVWSECRIRETPLSMLTPNTTTTPPRHLSFFPACEITPRKKKRKNYLKDCRAVI